MESDDIGLLLRSPLSAVDALWAGDAEKCASAVASKFSEQLTSSLPLLTRSAYLSSRLPPRGLVRFVGMVQDMANPEYYIPAAVVGGSLRCGVFRDHLGFAGEEVADPLDVARLAQRSPVYCVATPGQSKWASDRVATDNAAWTASSQEEQQRPKRGLDDVDSDSDDDDISMTVEDSSSKMQRVDVDATCEQPQKPRAQQQAAIIDCVARLYPGTGVSPKLNELVEFVGILGGDDAETLGVSKEFGQLSEDHGEEDIALWDPPLSVAARLHVVGMRTLPWYYPLQMPPTDHRDASPRDVVRSRLQRALGGDALAAEYALLALVSSVSARVGDSGMGGVVVGAMSLELVTDDMAAVATRLHECVSELVPRCVLVKASELSPPTRPPGSERLPQTPLQLVDGTTLIIIDDTADGSNEAVTALAGRSKGLDYDFGFSKVRFDYDGPTFVLTRRRPKATSFDADCSLPLAPSSATTTAADVDERERVYLASTRGRDVAITQTMGEALERDFVTARAKGAFAENSDVERVLHRNLTISRLIAKTHADGTLRLDHYRAATNFEAQRTHRQQI